MLCFKSGRCYLMTAAALSAAGAQAWAVDANDVLIYSAGPVRIKPHIAVSESYDDNIFLSPNTPTPGVRPVESDFLTVISPGVTAELGRREANHIFVDYLLDQTLYADHGSEDHRDHSISLDAKIGRNRLSAGGTTAVQFFAGALGGGFNQPGQRIDRVAYQNSYRVEYAMSAKTSTYVVGAFNATDYDKGISLYDENDWRGTAGFAYNFRSDQSLLGEFYYGQTAISANEDTTLADGPYSFVYGGFVGASGDFTSHLKGGVRAGYEYRGFGQNTPGSATPVFDISLTDTFSKWTAVSLNYSRRSEVSVQTSGQAYTSDTLTARLNQVLTTDGKLAANIEGDLANSDYSSNGAYANRHDVELRASVALVYRFQAWLLARLSYEYQKFNSNQYFDYTDNRVSVRVSAGF